MSPMSGRGFASSGIRERKIIYVRKIKFRIMSPRRCRDRPVVNATMEEEIVEISSENHYIIPRFHPPIKS
jgi:hypothetical protein